MSVAKRQASSEAAEPLAAAEQSGTDAKDPLGLVGSILDGRYLIERLVGSGGFGIVYRAIHLRFDSPVAIKVLRISRHLSAERRQRMLELFVSEGKLLFSLGALHPSIVRVFETGTLTAADGALTPYLAMEWLNGIPLDREIRRRSDAGAARWLLRDVIELLDPCVEGLTLAHGKRIAHRDVKPGNIFLAQRNGRIVPTLVDFGLAKVMSDVGTTTALLADSQFMESSFTPAYAAPEQWLRRLGATGTWTDVYALALVCAELLCGRRALQGSDNAQLMGACLDQALRPTPHALGIRVSDQVNAVFEKALAIDPRERYREIGAFWNALRRAMADSGESAERSAELAIDGPEASGEREVVVHGGVSGSSQQPTAPPSTGAMRDLAPVRARRAGARVGVIAAIMIASALLAAPLRAGRKPAPARATLRTGVPQQPVATRTAVPSLAQSSPAAASTVHLGPSDLEKPSARSSARRSGRVRPPAPATVPAPLPAAIVPEVAAPVAPPPEPPAPVRGSDPAELLNHDQLTTRK